MGPKKYRKNVRKIEGPTDTPIQLMYRGGGEERIDRGEEEAGEEEGESQKGGNSTVTHRGRSCRKKDQKLIGVTVKWTQRLEER